MATPETNVTGRGSSEVGGPGPAPPRHLHNFNTFQFVSQLVSATPPYLFNMSSPFPGNFFSDLLRRMAPRAGTPGLPPDQTLQQHIRAALLAKGTPPPPPSLPPTVMPPPLDLAASQRAAPPPMPQDKGVKRSLFSDVSALSSSEDDSGGTKRARMEESREDKHPPEGLPAPFLMQAPFLPGSVPPPHDLAPWSARAALLRPQVPLAAHPPPTPLDPYRLLLDLRLAGQLRTMAATQALQAKENPLAALHPALAPTHPALITKPRPSSPLPEPQRPPRDDPPPMPAQVGGLHGGDDRVSAFHPPGRPQQDPADTSDEDSAERRPGSRSSSGSSSREGMGPQYIFRHLTQIYRAIDNHKESDGAPPPSPDQSRPPPPPPPPHHEHRQEPTRDETTRPKEG